MNKMFKLVKPYLTIFFVFSIFYLLLFHSPLFSSVRVIFYRGVLLLLISFLCFVLGFFFLRRKVGIKEENFLAALVLSFSLHLTFFVVFPVTFERSVTMFFLRQLLSPTATSDSCPGLTPYQAEEALIEVYIRGKSAVAKRVEEQKIIGLVDDHDQCLQITDRGRTFLDFAKIVNKIYGLTE
ncbi:hypothetical protein FJZ41_03270 [Candidatus Shapirobacteria bacterium]|nr:hypothetical protein [Candidatus Shapirobacteria bacterium]